MKPRPWILYGWIVVAVCFVTLIMIYGLRYSFSVFYVAILDGVCAAAPLVHSDEQIVPAAYLAGRAIRKRDLFVQPLKPFSRCDHVRSYDWRRGCLL